MLDPKEISKIQSAVQQLNAIISEVAKTARFPVVDIYSFYRQLTVQRPTYAGVRLTNRYLGGIFSLDGIHPSDTSYALLANDFIRVINQTYCAKGVVPHIPPLTPEQIEKIARYDPFIDHKQNGSVKGRFGAGLLETLAPFVGLKHDAKHTARKETPDNFTAEYNRRLKKTESPAHEAFRHMFGLDPLTAHHNAKPAN